MRAIIPYSKQIISITNLSMLTSLILANEPLESILFASVRMNKTWSVKFEVQVSKRNDYSEDHAGPRMVY